MKNVLDQIRTNMSKEDRENPTIILLIELLEQQFEIILVQKEQIQLLKDEVARLKNQKPRPKIKPSKLTKDTGKKSSPKGSKSKKRKKTASLKIHKEKRIVPEFIPAGSTFTDYNGFGGGKPCTIFCNCLMGGMDKLVCPCKKRQCKVRKELSGALMIRVMRIYEIAWSPSQKGDTDKQVCPCHPSPIASPKSVIIRTFKGLNPYTVRGLQINAFNTRYLLEQWQTPEGEIIAGKLPPEVDGHFDHTLKSFILYQHYHYLGYTQPVGEHLKYIIFAIGRPIACFVFSSAPYSILHRDRFIGWKPKVLKKNRRLLAYNSRFLILPWIHVPHLASHLLAKCAKGISEDWQTLYRHPVFWLETFVDTDLFKGTCYQAANWIFLGNTSGRGKYNKTQKQLTSIKAMYGLPLTKNFRQKLCQG